MVTIDITKILSPDLKSRNRAADLLLFINNTQEKEVILDFQNVKFATRSFIDEFYNLFLRNPSENTFSLTITNVPEDINTMIETVAHTQTKAKIIPASSVVTSFDNVAEMIKYMNTVAF